MKRPAFSPFSTRGGAVATVLSLGVLWGLWGATPLAQLNPPVPESNAEKRRLTTAEQVQQLSRQDAARQLRAVIRGVVTCYLPTSDSLVIQDATRGVYVDQLGMEPSEAPQIGELIEVEGVTDPGQFAPQLHARRITRFGRGELPVPARPRWDQLINGSLDTQFVEIPGIITAVSSNSIRFLTHGGRILAHVYDTNGFPDGSKMEQFKHAKIRLRGCMFATWDPRTHHVRVGEISLQVVSTIVDEPAPADIFELPRKRASELKLFDPEASLLRRAVVNGQVVQQDAGGFYAMDGKHGFRFALTDPAAFAIGDLVEVVGFPSLGGPSPVLQEAVARRTGSASLPDPVRLDSEDLFGAGHDATRVRVVGVLQSLSGDHRSLELQSGLVRFLAKLNDIDKPLAMATPANSPASRLDLLAGSQLELTGVYSGYGGDPAAGGEIRSFELLLNSPMDIVVLARPTFWTFRRLLILVGTLSGILLLALIWIRLLHHKVQARTAQLQIEVREREQAEQQRALANERSRIARDLHDDLGSSLTEITLLATAGPGQRVSAAEASERLETIAGRSRTMVHALDEIVWAVDPERDTLSSVARYLASYAEEYLAGLKIPCRVQSPQSLPDRVVSGEARHELFLAVKEALNNAVRHGHATEVSFRMRLVNGQMEFVITDDGGGFEPANPSTGHGLSNLRTRLQKMRGTCEIESSPGGGTTVSLRLPLDPPGLRL